MLLIPHGDAISLDFMTFITRQILKRRSMAGVTAWYADFTPRSVRCIVKTHLKTAPEHAPPCVGEKCPIPCVPPHPPQCWIAWWTCLADDMDDGSAVQIPTRGSTKVGTSAWPEEEVMVREIPSNKQNDFRVHNVNFSSSKASHRLQTQSRASVTCSFKSTYFAPDFIFSSKLHP